MKKFLSLFLTLFILFSFAACGESKNNIPENNSSSSSNEGDLENNKVADNNGEITVEKIKNAPETSADDFTTQLVDGGIMITRYTGEEEIVIIPSKIDNEPVVVIGNNCFANNQTLKAVKIGDFVLDINANSFVNCFNLEIFISGNSVKKIGDYALSYCPMLRILELNDGIKSLGLSCFAATDSLDKVYMPSSVTELRSPFFAPETNVTIVAEAGSAAETYAKEEGIKYEIR